RPGCGSPGRTLRLFSLLRTRRGDRPRDGRRDRWWDVAQPAGAPAGGGPSWSPGPPWRPGPSAAGAKVESNANTVVPSEDELTAMLSPAFRSLSAAVLPLRVIVAPLGIVT